MIGSFQLEDESVHITFESEDRTLTPVQALRYLIALLEEAKLAEEFYQTLSK